MLSDTQCGLSSCRNITDQILTLQSIFEKSWEYAKDPYTEPERKTALKTPRQERAQGGGDRPLKAYESDFFHHYFVQFEKKHSRYTAILSSIVLTQQCREVYFISDSS